jgi:hypothetical protein
MTITLRTRPTSADPVRAAPVSTPSSPGLTDAAAVRPERREPGPAYAGPGS